MKLREPGLEPGTYALKVRRDKTASNKEGMTYDNSPEALGALLAVLAAQIDPHAPDLAALLRVWPALPEYARAGFVAMVRAIKNGDKREV